MDRFDRSRTVPQSMPESAATSYPPPDMFIPPRRPSLEPENEILATRGQRLTTLIRRRSISQSQDSPIGTESGREELWTEWMNRFPLGRAKKLIGDNNPMYRWQQHFKPQEFIDQMPKKTRWYHERNNDLISQYVYIDRLLDSSLPHRLIEDYHDDEDTARVSHSERNAGRIKRTPNNLYRIPDESSPLLPETGGEETPPLPDNRIVDTGARIVTVAIYVNFLANIILLLAKVIVTSMTSSLSVLASLVDGALDLLSTVIVWVTATLIQRQDRYRYPISQRRLEPLSVLIFAVVMATAFVQVAITSLSRLVSDDHSLVELTIPSMGVMASTVVIKLICWFWCRLIRNSSVQALAQDAMTDVIFNFFSIIFPLVGGFARVWWLDPLGGLFLSVYIIWNWSGTAGEHIRHLTGAAASPQDHSILLYMTMRFSKTIQKIQGLKAYYAGDLLNVEVDIILDEKITLRDSHDLGESLQYMLESLPIVDRAFVHMDYNPYNIPTHMNQQEQ